MSKGIRFGGKTWVIGSGKNKNTLHLNDAMFVVTTGEVSESWEVKAFNSKTCRVICPTCKCGIIRHNDGFKCHCGAEFKFKTEWSPSDVIRKVWAYEEMNNAEDVVKKGNYWYCTRTPLCEGFPMQYHRNANELQCGWCRNTIPNEEDQ